MLNELEQHVENLAGVDALLAAGDFNVRLPRPSWFACADADAVPAAEGSSPGKRILDEAAVSSLAAMLADPAGRRQLAMLDPITEHSPVPYAQRLAKMMRFDPLAEQPDPGYPTYKRTPGIVPTDDASLLKKVFFGMPPEDGKAHAPQREIHNRFGGDLQFMEIGWLDRGAWRVPASAALRATGGKLCVNIVSHEGFSSPALSDHAATVTEFRLWRGKAAA